MTDPFFRYNRFDPLADPAAVVTEGRARFTLLGERLVRMEFSPAGVFEDRPSQTFWFRKQPAPAFEVRRQAGGLEIETAALLLRYQPDGQNEFTRRSLRVTLKANGVTWHMGDRAPHARPKQGTTARRTF